MRFENPKIQALKESGHNYELLEDQRYTLKIGEHKFRITIKAGYKFDGASIPSALWGFPLMLTPAHPRIINGALIHDALYQAKGLLNSTDFGRLEMDPWGTWGKWIEFPFLITKAEADNIFFSVNRIMGMDKVRLYATYYAVKLFGRY